MINTNEQSNGMAKKPIVSIDPSQHTCLEKKPNNEDESPLSGLDGILDKYIKGKETKENGFTKTTKKISLLKHQLQTLAEADLFKLSSELETLLTKLANTGQSVTNPPTTKQEKEKIELNTSMFIDKKTEFRSSKKKHQKSFSLSHYNKKNKSPQLQFHLEVNRQKKQLEKQLEQTQLKYKQLRDKVKHLKQKAAGYGTPELDKQLSNYKKIVKKNEFLTSSLRDLEAKIAKGLLIKQKKLKDLENTKNQGLRLYSEYVEMCEKEGLRPKLFLESVDSQLQLSNNIQSIKNTKDNPPFIEKLVQKNNLEKLIQWNSRQLKERYRYLEELKFASKGRKKQKSIEHVKTELEDGIKANTEEIKHLQKLIEEFN